MDKIWWLIFTAVVSAVVMGIAVGLAQWSDAVRKWIMRNETHPSNAHLQRILTLAFRLDQDRAFEILERDLFINSKSESSE